MPATEIELGQDEAMLFVQAGHEAHDAPPTARYALMLVIWEPKWQRRTVSSSCGWSSMRAIAGWAYPSEMLRPSFWSSVPVRISRARRRWLPGTTRFSW